MCLINKNRRIKPQTVSFLKIVAKPVAIPDEKKGEQLMLFTTIAQPERAVIAEGLKSRGASDLMIPKVLVHLEEIPLLGSGKTDYVTLTRISNEGANG